MARFVGDGRVAGESRNLPERLQQTEAVIRTSGAHWQTVSEKALAQRAGYFAAAVRLGLAEPEAMRRLHEATRFLRDATSLSILLPRVLDGALSVMAADSGVIQLLDPGTGSLRLVTQSGFSSEFLDHFAVVDDGHSACGRAASEAARECAQIVISDASADPGFAPRRDIAAASDFCAVQSTPLVDYAGHLVGVVSTHFRRPYHPPDLDLQIIQLYADFAGELIAGRVGVLDAGPGDPIGRAVLSALLDPGGDQETGVTVPPGLGDSCRDRPEVEAASLDDPMFRFADYVVTRLFSVSLRLEGARSILANGLAHDRVAAATDEIDRMIRDIRTMLFRLAAEHRQPPADRSSLPPDGDADRSRELLDGVANSILQVSVLLQAAADLPRGTAERRISEALSRLDEVLQQVRERPLAGHGQPTWPGVAAGSGPNGHGRLWQAADRAARLQERVVRTVRALQMAAVDAAALLEQQAVVAKPPTQIDYSTEIKRLRTFADQAGQMAKRWGPEP